MHLWARSSSGEGTDGGISVLGASTLGVAFTQQNTHNTEAKSQKELPKQNWWQLMTIPWQLMTTDCVNISRLPPLGAPCTVGIRKVHALGAKISTATASCALPRWPQGTSTLRCFDSCLNQVETCRNIDDLSTSLCDVWCVISGCQGFCFQLSFRAHSPSHSSE